MRIRVSNLSDGGYLVEFHGTRGLGQGYACVRGKNRAALMAECRDMIARVEADRQVRRGARSGAIG